jgi:integrase
MGVYQRGNIWWYEFVFEGKRIRESSGSTRQEIAERLEWKRFEALNERRHDIVKPAKHKFFGGEGRPKSNVPAGAAKAYMQEREPHWSAKTRVIHANSLRHLQHHFGKLLLNEINASDIARYQRERHREGASNRSINIEVGLVRLVLRKARLWNKIADDVQMLNERAETGRELSDDEVHRLLSACKSSRSRGLYPAVLTSIHTGLRSQELRLLRWHQVDLIEGTIAVGKSKTRGGEGRVVYLSSSAVATLKTWRSQFPNAQPGHAVFPREKYGLKGKEGTFGGEVVPYETVPDQPVQSFKTAWKTAKKKAGVECRWHDLRHSCASRLAAGGATDQTLQALLGWMSPKMIERYSHVRNEAKRRAVSVFDPKPVKKRRSPQKSPQAGQKSGVTVQ